jgi:GR25 family glycosyltransferase involved in LPS biosynthesis
VKFKIINLERDKKKYVRANSICSAINLDYEIVKAVDGNELKEQYIQELSYNTNRYGLNKTLNRGEIGLYMSHCSVLKEFLLSGEDYICVLEDDFYFHKHFLISILELENAINMLNFDFILLGHYLLRKEKGILGSNFIPQKFSTFKLQIPLEVSFGTHAYIISRSGAEKFISLFSVPLIPIDHIIGCCETFGFIRLIVNKPIVYQSLDFKSTIQNGEFKKDNIFIYYLKKNLKRVIYLLLPAYAKSKLLKFSHNGPKRVLSNRF